MDSSTSRQSELAVPMQETCTDQVADGPLDCVCLSERIEILDDLALNLGDRQLGRIPVENHRENREVDR
jgi:hypothetical protein